MQNNRLFSAGTADHLCRPILKVLGAIEMYDGVVGSRTRENAQRLRTAMQHLLAEYANQGPARVAEVAERIVGLAMYARDWVTTELERIHLDLQSLPPPGSSDMV